MRGVHVRVYLDGEQMGRSESAALQIAATPMSNCGKSVARAIRCTLNPSSSTTGLAQRLGQFQRVGRGLSRQRLIVIESRPWPKLHRKFRAAVGARRQSADRRPMTRARVMVLGAGAWGVALANVAAFKRDHVALWGHDPSMSRRWRAIGRTAAICRACRLRARWRRRPISRSCRRPRSCWAFVPAQAMRGVARLARPFLREGAAFVACAKGIERGSHKFMSEVIAEEAPQVEVARFPAKLCLGCLQGAANRGDAGVKTRGGGAAPRRAIVYQILSAVSLYRFARRRDRRRGQERAGDRLRMAAGRELGASARRR